MPTRKHVAMFSLMTSGLVLAALPSLGGPDAPAAAKKSATKVKPTPEWVLPQTRAREVAKERRVPLLIVSLNGNLDGYC